MKRLLILAAAAASLMTSACVTVIDASDDNHVGWHGENAQPFDSALAGCRHSAGSNERTDVFAACMAARGWSRDRG